MTLLSKIRFFLIALTFIVAFGSCKKDKNDVIPNTTVNFSISLNDPQFIKLSAFGNAVLIDKYTNNFGLRAAGFDENGIIVYSWIDNEFYAYDRTCPHDYAVNNLSVKVNLDPKDSYYAVCPKCGTVYALSTGGVPSSGIGRYPLKNYRTSFDGLNIFVSNY